MKKIVLITIIAITAALIYHIDTLSAFNTDSERNREEAIMNSKNYNGEEFVNTVPTEVTTKGSFLDTMWKWIAGKEEREPSTPLERFSLSVEELTTMPKSGLRVTWLGHSSVLIEIDGKRFLTDPVWSKRVSPISFMGPARFFEPVLELNQLPPLDGVLISHDHYDHLDEATIKALSSNNTEFYVPLGVGKYLEKWGISEEKIHEFDWWESVKIGRSHTLVAAPARHFSGRNLFRRNKTLWASWIIMSSKHRVYFGGDSGYFPGYKTIGEKYGPFEITMLEIGAYHPNWGTIHLGPENALKAHQDLKGKALLPIHWGTFTLAMHGWTDPIEDLITGAREKEIQLSIPRPGQPVQDPYLTTNSEWWRKDKTAGSNKLAEEVN
jgi:L-ascorbate metabolism protein UlaG (beta-lactamase superfamily)